MFAEMISDTVQQRPSSLLCYLDRYSGFAPLMSSFSSTFPTRTLSASFQVGEVATGPPFHVGSSANHFIYPRPAGDDDSALTHLSSRLELMIDYQRTYALGVLEMAPALFIGISSTLNYALPPEDYRSRLTSCTTALLAAVVQHGSLRSQLPPQSILTEGDLLMVVIYTIISAGMLSSVTVAVTVHHEILRHHAVEVSPRPCDCSMHGWVNGNFWHAYDCRSTVSPESVV